MHKAVHPRLGPVPVLSCFACSKTRKSRPFALAGGALVDARYLPIVDQAPTLLDQAALEANPRQFFEEWPELFRP